MNHKYSTIAIIGILFILAITIVSAVLTSSDIDEVCDSPNSFLYRFNDKWDCGKLNSSDFTITYNTTIINTTLVRLNESDPIWSADKPNYASKTYAQSLGNWSADKLNVTAKQMYYGKPAGSTSAWTVSIPGISAYSDNLMVVLTPTYASSSTTTLNINGLGAKKIYYGATSQSSYFSATYTYLFVYDSTKDSGNGAFTGIHSYDSDSNAYMLRQVQATKAAAAITANHIITGTNAGYKHLSSGSAFDITLPILWAQSSITSGATGTNNYFVYYSTIATTQALTLTAYAPVYIKGTLVGKTFTPVSTTPLTQTEPSTADGYDYMILGYAYSTTSMYLTPTHEIYKYINGAFRLTTDNSGLIPTSGVTSNMDLNNKNITNIHDLTANGVIRAIEGFNAEGNELVPDYSFDDGSKWNYTYGGATPPYWISIGGGDLEGYGPSSYVVPNPAIVPEINGVYVVNIDVQSMSIPGSSLSLQFGGKTIPLSTFTSTTQKVYTVVVIANSTANLRITTGGSTLYLNSVSIKKVGNLDIGKLDVLANLNVSGTSTLNTVNAGISTFTSLNNQAGATKTAFKIITGNGLYSHGDDINITTGNGHNSGSDGGDVWFHLGSGAQYGKNGSIKLTNGDIRIQTGKLVIAPVTMSATITYPLEVKSNYSGISAWFGANISTTGVNLRSEVYNKSLGSALERIEDADTFLDTTGKINHTKYEECMVKTPIITQIGEENESEYITTYVDEYSLECMFVRLYQGVAEINKAINVTNTTIDGQTAMFENIFTKSKVPSITGNYFNLFDNSIYNKTTHHAYTLIDGKPRLNQENRDVAQEGYIACDRRCTLQATKWDEYKSCKMSC